MVETLVVNLFGAPGAGKCFRSGTKVLMYDGMIKKVEDIKVGDYLMGPDSKKRRVFNLSKGKDTLFEVKPVKGDSFYVTRNHILPLKFNCHCKEKVEKYSIEEFIKLREYRKKRLKLYRSECINFPEKEVLMDPYFIGCWLGDGNCANQGITTIDDEIIYYLKKIAEKFNMKTTLVAKTGTNAVRVNITNGQCGGKPNEVLNILRKLNLIHNKHIPDIYKINSRHNRLLLLAGLIDTDGSRSHNCIEIVTKYDALSEDIKFLCRSLGYAAYESKKIVDNKSYHRILISGDLKDIPVLLKRKKCSKRLQIKSTLRTGLSVIKYRKENFYGFEVDGDHLFLLSDFTVTHNSTTSAGVFSLLKLQGLNCELVTEFAKSLVWKESLYELNNQMYVTGNQYHNMYILNNKVDVIITDSPLILGLVYNTVSDTFIKLTLELFNSFNNLNYFINCTKEYNNVGRIQSKEEAKKVDKKLKTFIVDNVIGYQNVDGNYKGINTIVSDILKIKNKINALKIISVD